MPIIATEGENKQRQLVPAGTHIARCYGVIDLGTQPSDFGERRKITIKWELPDETAIFNAEKGPQPFVVEKSYTLSLFEKANLRKDLESWKGAELTEQERKSFDVASLIGVPCLLTIVHKTNQAGKTFASVTGVAAPPKGMVCKPQVNPSLEYSVSDGDNAVYKLFPQWLQERIAQAEEWQHTPVEPQNEVNPFNEGALGDDDGPPF